MKKMTALLICFLSINVYSQKIKYIYQILDKETKEPIEKASIIEQYGKLVGLTDVNGIIKFKASSTVDSIMIFCSTYKELTVKLEQEGIVYMDPVSFQLGTLKMYSFEIDSKLDCPNLMNLPPYDPSRPVNDGPRYHGGLLCFDTYIYKEIINQIPEYSKIDTKQIKVQFTITKTGEIKNINIDKKLPNDFNNIISKIFLDSSEWIPARMYETFINGNCIYNIKFKQ